jgi:hypothetical protein
MQLNPISTRRSTFATSPSTPGSAGCSTGNTSASSGFARLTSAGLTPTGEVTPGSASSLTFGAGGRFSAPASPMHRQPLLSRNANSSGSSRRESAAAISPPAAAAAIHAARDSSSWASVGGAGSNFSPLRAPRSRMSHPDRVPYIAAGVSTAASAVLNDNDIDGALSSPESAITSGHRHTASIEACSICLVAPPNALVIPCGHSTFCHSCIKRWSAQQGRCPVCRYEIEDITLLSRKKKTKV